MNNGESGSRPRIECGGKKLDVGKSEPMPGRLKPGCGVADARRGSSAGSLTPGGGWTRGVGIMDPAMVAGCLKWG